MEANPLQLIESNFKIVGKDKRSTPFRLNRVQLRLYQDLCRHKDVIILKARQEGVSSLVMALWLVECMFVRNTRSVVISHEKNATRRLFSRVKYYVDNLEVRPTLEVQSKDELSFPVLESSFYIGTAGSKAFGRGDTIHNLHCSEVALWENAKDLMDGVGEAVVPGGRKVLESTAYGMGGYFYDTWINAKEGQSNFVPVFFPWFIDDGYRTPLDVGEVIEYTAQEAELVARCGLMPEQVKWRRAKIYDLGKKFYQEFPEDDVTCFLQSGRPVFDAEDVQRAFKPLPPLLSAKGVVQWREFAEGAEILAFLDSSGGSEDGDFCSADFLDKITGEQLAQIHGHWKPEKFAEIVHEFLEDCRKKARFEVRLGVEENNHGHTTILRLKQLGEKPLPWNTNTKTKDLLIDQEEEAIRKGWLVIHSPETVSELCSMQYDKNGSANARSGCYDDRVISLGGAYQMRRRGGIMIMRVDDAAGTAPAAKLVQPGYEPLPEIKTAAAVTDEQLAEADKDLMQQEEKRRLYF